MKITALELAQVLHGTVDGNPETAVTRLSKIEDAGPDAISFFANPKYKNYVYTSKAGILLVDKNFNPEKPITSTLIRVENVYSSMALLQDHFSSNFSKPAGISDLAFIASSVKIGKNAAISAFAVVEENATIGDNCIIYPHVYIGPGVTVGNNTLLYPGVKIYQECHIGDHCILHANCVIGSDGFGFAPLEDGTYKKIQQVGNVVIENHVEVGAGTAIDRATMGSTIIRRGVKLDNLVQIAHNVEIGENTVVAAQAGFAGSTQTGKNCQIGGQAGFAGHLKVGDNTRVQAQSGLNRSFPEGNISIGGSPAMQYRDYYRSYALFRRLPEMQKKLEELEKIIREMKGE